LTLWPDPESPTFPHASFNFQQQIISSIEPSSPIWHVIASKAEQLFPSPFLRIDIHWTSVGCRPFFQQAPVLHLIGLSCVRIRGPPRITECSCRVLSFALLCSVPDSWYLLPNSGEMWGLSAPLIRPFSEVYLAQMRYGR
jgi:hypothetical protein